MPKIRIQENHPNSTRDVLRIRMMRATLKGISHREVLNAASREANGIKMLQRTRDSSQKRFVASTHRFADIYGQDLAYIQATAYGDLARGAAPEIVRLLRSASIPIRRVVDVGCGAGPLTLALVDAGFEVTAIDNSKELLSIARATVPRARFINASIYNQEIPACEAVIAVGEPLTYHESHEADALVQNLFQKVSDVLLPGGIFVFDLIETGEPSLSGKIWKAGDDWAVLVDTEEDQDSQTIVRNIETFRKVGDLYRRDHETHRVRVFDTDALCHRLAALGFVTKTAQAYGPLQLPPRRRAFFCTRALLR